MNDKDLDNILDKFKREIPVNMTLKNELRQSFADKKKSGVFKKLAVFAAAVILILASAVFLNNKTVIEKVSAASLKVWNHVSFVDIGNGGNIGVSEYKGTIYIPVAGKGLFAYDKTGFYKLYDGEINFVRVSPDGKKLALSASGNIIIYDLGTKNADEILKGDNASVYYEEPSWAPDNSSIVYTKKVIERGEVHGFTVKESGIYEIDLKSLKSQKLADGSYASRIKGLQAVVFERENKIIFKDLENGSEKIISGGRFPSVSPDGAYIAFVGTSDSEKELSKNTKVIESVDNVFISDTTDFSIKNKVTSNYAYKFTDENEWLNGLKPSEVPQVLNYTGMYSYYNPVWSTDSKSLFVLKNLNSDTAGNSMKLSRIDFNTGVLTTEETTKRFLQALLLRDEDYAKSMMNNPPDILTVSNPHRTGYNIVSAGSENGKDYVDAEVYWGYTSDSYFQIVKSRYYISSGENGYIIDSIKDINSLEVYGKNSAINLKEGDTKDINPIEPSSVESMIYLDDKSSGKKELFSKSDIPWEYILPGEMRFSSLAYNTKNNTLAFTIQFTGKEGSGSSVELLDYDLASKHFRLIDRIESLDGVRNAAVSELITSPDGENAALNIFSQNGQSFRGYTFVYNLKDNKKYNLNDLFDFSAGIDSMSAAYWDGSSLFFNVTGNGQTMKYVYVPGQAQR